MTCGVFAVPSMGLLESDMRTPRQIERHEAAAKLRMMARELNKWQIEECLLISRKLNNRLFEAEMDMRRAARAVWKGYDRDHSNSR